MSHKKFCVIGLGYFGYNLATQLSSAGAEVLALDNRQDIIDKIGDRVTHAICMDAADPIALGGLDLQDFDAVVVAIGEQFESSINTTAILQEIGVKKIYNRVVSPIHERLLKLMKIEDLLIPEAESAAHLAKRMLLSGILGSFELSQEFSVFELIAPEEFVGKKIIDLNLRKESSLNLITIKRSRKLRAVMNADTQSEMEVLGVPSPDDVINASDVLVLFGQEKDLKRFLAKYF